MNDLQEFLGWLDALATSLESSEVICGSTDKVSVMKEYQIGYSAGWLNARLNIGSQLRYAIEAWQANHL